MKDIITKINESNKEAKNGSAFSEKVKYNKKDWDNWLENFYNSNFENKHILIGHDVNSEMICVYIKNGEKLNHIASYNPKTSVLYTDDIHLFGNEK
jgi:hypothetical protein